MQNPIGGDFGGGEASRGLVQDEKYVSNCTTSESPVRTSRQLRGGEGVDRHSHENLPHKQQQT